MIKQRIEEFVEKQTQQILVQLPFVMRDHERTVLAELYNALVSLRSTLQMLLALKASPSDFNKVLKELNPVIKKCTELREYHLMLLMVNSIDYEMFYTCRAFRIHLQQRSVKAENALIKQIKKLGLKQLKKLNKQISKYLEPFDSKYLDENTLKFAEKKLKILFKHLKEKKKPDQEFYKNWQDALSIIQAGYFAESKSILKISSSLNAAQAQVNECRQKSLVLDELDKFGIEHNSKSLRYFPEEAKLKAHLQVECKDLWKKIVHSTKGSIAD